MNSIRRRYVEQVYKVQLAQSIRQFFDKYKGEVPREIYRRMVRTAEYKSIESGFYYYNLLPTDVQEKLDVFYYAGITTIPIYGAGYVRPDMLLLSYLLEPFYSYVYFRSGTGIGVGYVMDYESKSYGLTGMYYKVAVRLVVNWKCGFLVRPFDRYQFVSIENQDVSAVLIPRRTVETEFLRFREHTWDTLVRQGKGITPALIPSYSDRDEVSEFIRSSVLQIKEVELLTDPSEVRQCYSAMGLMEPVRVRRREPRLIWR